MAADLVIRGGRVVDGTGAPSFEADVAISNGRIADIGPGLRGSRELDAGGQLVAPGFIDIHTHYDAKLDWLARVGRHLKDTCDPTGEVVVCGDFNVAPEDRDVWDPTAAHGATHVSAPERDALGVLLDWGLVDVFRRLYDDDRLFSWWDYRAGDFHKHKGMRIDLMLVSKAMADRATFALIDRFARKGKGPSDHAPLLVDFER